MSLKCSSSVSREAVRLNANGVLLLQQGRFSEALDTFHDGIDEAMKSKSGFASPSPGGESKVETRRLINSVPLTPGSVKFLTVQDDLFHLFHRALHLQWDGELVAENDSIDHLLSAVFTYNIGLVYHLAGLREGSSRLLVKALEFYKLLHANLTEPSSTFRRYQSSLSVCMLSVLNNMGHIHVCLYNFKEAARCKNDVFLLLQALVHSHSFLTCEGAIVFEEFQVFFLNVSFFDESKLCAAAAA